MALIQPLIGRMSGSVAGNVWSHNKGGQYVRQRTKPVNHTSVRRTFVHSSMSNNSRAWATLTDAQRAAWTGFATANPILNRLGDSITVSGINMFNRLNQRVSDLGLSTLATPPASVGPAGLLTITVTNASNVLTLTFTTTPLPAGVRIAIWSTGARGPGVDPNFNQSRLHGYTAAAAATGATFTLPYAVTTGQVINMYFQTVDASGRASAPRKVRLVVA